MLHNHTIEKLKEMKLLGIAQALEEQLSNSSINNLSFEERLGMLIDRESSLRKNKQLSRLLSNAKLKYAASIEDINYRTDRQLDKQTLSKLSDCQWIRAGHNILITEATGCGKTWLACAFGNQACRLGFTVYYIKMSKLCDHLRITQGDGSFRTQLAKLAKFDLLIIDDLGLSKPNHTDRTNFLEVVDERHKKAIIVTSQLPTDKWHEFIGEATLADAILDRLTNDAYELTLKGESLRNKNKILTNLNDHDKN